GRDKPGHDVESASNNYQGWSYTLTSGTFGTEPRGDEPPSPRGPGGLLRRCAPGLRFGLVRIGIFSGLGVTGPSGNSKPSLLSPVSSLRSITRTWPPALSLPNSTSSASGFLIVSWISRAIGRAPICSS